MKKLFFALAMTAFASNAFALALPGTGGCTNSPGKNDGHCASSTTGGVTNYYCVDTTATKDCVKGKDI
jgi:hypothetical protein